MILTWYSSTYTVPSPLTWAGLCDCSKVTGRHFLVTKGRWLLSVLCVGTLALGKQAAR